MAYIASAKHWRSLIRRSRPDPADGWTPSSNVVLLKSKDTTDDAEEIWNLLMPEAPAKQDGQRAEQNGNRQPNAAAARDSQRPLDDRSR
jgi:hypothetical protein